MTIVYSNFDRFITGEKWGDSNADAIWAGRGMPPGYLEDFDFSQAIFHSFEQINFNWMDMEMPGSVIFSSSQFGDGLIANNVQVYGAQGRTELIINLTPNGSIDASQWQFMQAREYNWIPNEDFVTFYAASGNHTVKGSSQVDTFVFHGSYSDYSITSSPSGGYTISDRNVGRDGITNISNVEIFKFSDVTKSSAELNVVQIDITSPLLLSSNPSDNALSVAVGSNIVLTFTEAVQKGFGNIIISNGTDTRSISIADSQVVVNGSTVTINPTADLLAGTSYNVQMASGVLKDLAGNVFAGISNATVLNFTTAIPSDKTAPTVSTFSPADSSLTASINSNIVISFNESIKKGIGLIEIHQGSATGTLVEKYDIASSKNVSISGSQLTIDPTDVLKSASSYFVTIAPGAIKDIAGNSYAGTNTYDFKTAVTPGIFGDSIANRLTGTVNADNIYGLGGADFIAGGKSADSLWGGSGKDTFSFLAGDSGQTTNVDKIMDYAKGAVGIGDVIDYRANLTVGGSSAAATTAQALINQSTGVATFASGSGASLTDALNDIAARFTTATNSAGEFAFFKVKGTGDYYQFISDGTAGLTANDVVIQLVGVSSISSINLTAGDLTITS